MKPDFKSEALVFAKKHNLHRDLPLQFIEKAMEHGAGLMAGHVTLKLKAVRTKLKLQRNSSFRQDSGETKVIAV